MKSLLSHRKQGNPLQEGEGNAHEVETPHLNKSAPVCHVDATNESRFAGGEDEAMPLGRLAPEGQAMEGDCFSLFFCIYEKH